MADEAILTALRDAHDVEVLDALRGFVEDAKTVATTISAAMMTFVGVVFSISLAAVQMAAVLRWTELVDLRFAEIRGCSADTPQVTRRQFAGFDDPTLLAPENQREPLTRHHELLTRAMERVFPDPVDRAFALRPDRQGIG
ncbi:hypothetical protein ABZT48_08840 [Streptomyces avermitilis]|uniref:hypothetical protein n=1 Tax=Streptomyces avermitilis TaxID=33903 RepID=UPI0033A7068A